MAVTCKPTDVKAWVTLDAFMAESFECDTMTHEIGGRMMNVLELQARVHNHTPLALGVLEHASWPHPLVNGPVRALWWFHLWRTCRDAFIKCF